MLKHTTHIVTSCVFQLCDWREMIDGEILKREQGEQVSTFSFTFVHPLSCYTPSKHNAAQCRPSLIGSVNLCMHVCASWGHFCCCWVSYYQQRFPKKYTCACYLFNIPSGSDLWYNYSSFLRFLYSTHQKVVSDTSLSPSLSPSVCVRAFSL